MTQPINLTPTRNHKIKSDYGMNDYYRFYKTNMGGTLGVKEFSKVFRILMEAMRQIVIENNYKYKLSSRMGVITTRKYKNKITFKDGKMVIKYLEGHPEDLHQHGTTLTVLALKQAFPCK